jgi:hypothetical protein
MAREPEGGAGQSVPLGAEGADPAVVKRVGTLLHDTEVKRHKAAPALKVSGGHPLNLRRSPRAAQGVAINARPIRSRTS